MEGFSGCLPGQLVEQEVDGFLPFESIFFQESGSIEDLVLIKLVVWSINEELVFQLQYDVVQVVGHPFESF